MKHQGHRSHAGAHKPRDVYQLDSDQNHLLGETYHGFLKDLKNTKGPGLAKDNGNLALVLATVQFLRLIKSPHKQTELIADIRRLQKHAGKRGVFFAANHGHDKQQNGLAAVLDDIERRRTIDDHDFDIFKDVVLNTQNLKPFARENDHGYGDLLDVFDVKTEKVLTLNDISDQLLHGYSAALIGVQSTREAANLTALRAIVAYSRIKHDKSPDNIRQAKTDAKDARRYFSTNKHDMEADLRILDIILMTKSQYKLGNHYMIFSDNCRDSVLVQFEAEDNPVFKDYMMRKKIPIQPIW